MTADRIVHLLLVQSAQLAAVVVVIATITTVACRRRPHLAYALWLAALAKCLVPPVVASPVGLFSWAAAQRPTSPAVVTPIPLTPPPIPGVAASAATVARSESVVADPPTIAATRVQWPAALVVIWLSGTGATLALTVVASARLTRRIRAAAVPIRPDIADLADAVRRSLGVRRPPRLRATTVDVGPALLGVIRPVVVLPAHLLAAPPADLRAVLAHELAHLRRGDAAVAAVQRVAVALWWFHPLVWLMSAQLTLAREGCCDEAAIAGLGLDPLAYAQTLLDVARRRRGRTLALLPGVNAMSVTTQRLMHLTAAHARFRRGTPLAAWAVGGMAAVIALPGVGPASRPAAVSPATRPTTINHGAVSPTSGPGQHRIVFRGTITDRATSRPIEGALVTITFYDYDTLDPIGSRSMAYTGHDGAYDTEVPTAALLAAKLGVRVDATAPQYAPMPFRVCPAVVHDGQVTSTASRRVLVTGWPVSVRLVDESGRPLAGVDVSPISYGPPLPGEELTIAEDHCRTDRDGRVTFTAIAHASLVEVYPFPADRAAVYARLDEDYDQPQKVVAPPGTIVTGTVLDAAGRPEVGARLRAFPKSVDDLGPLRLDMRSATTDAAGRFTFGPLAAGKYEIDGYLATPGGADHGMVPPSDGVFPTTTIKVADPNGRPMAVTIRVPPTGGGH